MSDWHDFHGPNAGYVLELYERYQDDPASVDGATRAFFGQWAPPLDGRIPAGAAALAGQVSLTEVVAAANLAHAIRSLGYLAARLDPLGTSPNGDPRLEPETHGLTADTLKRLPAELIAGPVAQNAANAFEALEALRAIYCTTVGYDFDHVTQDQEREWLRDAVETGRFRSRSSPIDPVYLLERLTQVEAFEQFLHRIFPGKHRFSIEGLDIMVPLIDEIICLAAENGVGSVLLGMAHRGRLNVMAHVLHRPYAEILAEFKDPRRGHHFRDDLGWTGDVEYHKGAYRAASSSETCDIAVSLPPNPSHVESINPVLAGMMRAAGSRVSQPGPPEFDPTPALAVLVHGDAAFPAEGIVAESLNLSRLPGYWIGGTVHIIANNQIGFTTNPEDARSTTFASTLAKGFKIPVVHVNADDPEACIEAARMAFAYRATFFKDFLIDLIGYRRWGHNEGDEPGFTQPRMYQIIRDHPTVRARWADTLVRRGIIKAERAEQMVRQRMDVLQQVYDSLDPARDLVEPIPRRPPAGIARRVKTGVALERLQELNDALLTLPEGFNLHPKIARVMDRRRESLADPDAQAVDWATAEQLALATILQDGIAVRMTGQDVERGTFSQRHAVFHDQQTGDTYTPLQSIRQAKASFEIHNSPLTENAALGFEYGYNIQEPGRLVIWEAQYGDFVNNAQMVIDEFVSSARAKWGLAPSLVMLLPHGYEGAGPDHSSGRLERYLQLTSETNMRITYPTTAAQFFHLLRRQAALLEVDPLPLIVMTPKSLLRQPLVYSTLRELADGHWQPVIDDAEMRNRAGDVRRVFLCSGKVWVDLVSSEYRDESPGAALVRVEQLYPFPADDVKQAIDGYPNAEEIVWVQEEPRNMGAWTFVSPQLVDLLENRWPLRYVGRASSASPAEGSHAYHQADQETLVRQAYHPEPNQIQGDFIIG
jgi:2-oxoglutarate dehydrogenase E1 component